MDVEGLIGLMAFVIAPLFVGWVTRNKSIHLSLVIAFIVSLFFIVILEAKSTDSSSGTFLVIAILNALIITTLLTWIGRVIGQYIHRI